MAAIASAAPELEQTEFDPTAGWEDLLSALLVLGGIAVAVLVVLGIGAWMTSRRARFAGEPAGSDDDPSAP